jgi:hypothetical protein
VVPPRSTKAFARRNNALRHDLLGNFSSLHGSLGSLHGSVSSLRGSVSSLQGTLGTRHGAHTLRGEYLGAPEEQVRKRRFNTTSRRHLGRNSGEQVTIWRRNSGRRRHFRSMLGRLWRRLTASAQGRTGRAIRRQKLANARLSLFGRQAMEAGAIGRPVQDSRCATSLARTTGRTLQRDR